MLDAVFFDLDETLVDQRTAAAAAVATWAAQHGINDPEVARRWAEVSERHYQLYQAGGLTFQEQRRCRVREFLQADLDDAQADELFEGYLQRYEAGWVVFDDAIPALSRARDAGLIIAILTNGEHQQQVTKIDRLRLSPHIDVLIASSTLPAGKPDPRSFNTALEVVGTTAARSLMVGDSFENDVRGAQACGMSGVLLDRHDLHTAAGVPRIRSLDQLTFTA